MKSIDKMKERVKYWSEKAEWFKGSEVEGHKEMRNYCEGVLFGIKYAIAEIEKELYGAKITKLLSV